MPTPSTCCGKSGQGCVCASQAKCSCGEKSALHCSCDKASTENEVTGPRCSCRARPAGACTCDRASTENTTPSGSLCSCGSRPAVWSKLGEYLVDDAYNFCENAPWTCHHLWLILTFIVLLAGSGLAVGYLSTSRPQEFELLNKVFRSASFYVKSACEVKIIAQIAKAVPIFWKQLRMNLFLSRMTGDDGEIMVIQGSEEKSESKKTKTKLGVPKSIRDQKKQAIESAQAVVNKKNGNGSVGKAAGPMNKK
ncbi:hypothetical protein IFR04_001994 [Cadophora malorum]|uniref:DUF7871 domain-containing protein n=1 Tax=Cadophora malorum TaxID=108018 RepID=A0A8H7WHF0_9HELO|nr:hypothetical protein IFR04_001994 [Cadophora malorum]